MADPLIATWILEFLLRCPDITDAVAGELLLALPVPSPHPPRISSAILLRRLSADLSRRSVSSCTLHSLEHLHRLYPSPSLLPAFAAVAVECTVAPLRRCPLPSTSSSSSSSPADSDVEAEFFDAVNKIWNCLVADLERSEAAGLVSSLELRKARKEMEAAVADSGVRKELVRRETKEAALEEVRVCVEAVTREMGPTFLEAAAETIGGCNCGEMIGGCNCGEMVGSKVKALIELGDKLRTLHRNRFDPVGRDVEMPHSPNEMDRSRSRLLSGLVASSSRIQLNGGNVGEDQPGVIELDNNEPQSAQLDPILSDPKENQNCNSSFAVESVSPDGKSLTHNSSDTIVTTRLDSTPTEKLSFTDSSDRSASSHTYEFVSIPTTNFQQSPESREEMNCLSSKNLDVSSLLDKTEEFVLRRRKRKWNLLEEETLKKPVSEFGAGNWKLIKGRYPEIDLKDKWRNMTKRL